MSAQVPLFEREAHKQPNTTAQAREMLAGDFDAKRFIENFEVLAEADGSVERLREMVLDLAVRGLLVPQLPGEHVDVLVTELAKRRAEVAANTRARAHLAEVAVEEEPFRIPPSWRWLRLGHFGGFLGGGTPSKSNTSFWSGAIPWVSPKDMKRPYIDDAEDHISEAAVEESAVKLIPRRSLLFVVRGMILAHSFPVALTTKKVTVNQDMKALVLAVPEADEYVLRACWAARARVLERVERSSHGTCRLEAEAVEELPIPVPPLGEQKRIVAKVDQLMHMLDDLEAKQAKKRETQTRLRTAALDALTLAEGPEEFEAAWKKVTANFGILFERGESIADLRRLLGDLAVRGVLHDSTTHEYVAGSNGVDRSAPFEIPVGWRWVTLNDICERTDYGTSQKAHVEPSGVPVLRMNNIQDGRLDLGSIKYVPHDTESIEALMLAPGDLLFNRTNSYELVGKMAVFNEQTAYTFASYLIRVRLTEAALPEYVNLYFSSNVCRTTQIEPHITQQTNQANFNGSKLRAVLIPLPPLTEQRRIFAKVEYLMKLCDDLEAKLHRAETTAAKLAEALVAEMVA